MDHRQTFGAALERLLSGLDRRAREPRLLDAAQLQFAAPWIELWRALPVPGGSAWWPIRSRGLPPRELPWDLVLDQLRAPATIPLPAGLTVAAGETLALVSEAPPQLDSRARELAEDRVLGLLLVAGALEGAGPLVDEVPSPVAPQGARGSPRTRICLAALAAALGPQVRLCAPAPWEGRELAVSGPALVRWLAAAGRAAKLDPGGGWSLQLDPGSSSAAASGARGSGPVRHAAWTLHAAPGAGIPTPDWRELDATAHGLALDPRGSVRQPRSRTLWLPVVPESGARSVQP
jgi:hypothetical protein